MAVSTQPATSGVLSGVSRNYAIDNLATAGAASATEQILKQVTIPGSVLLAAKSFSIRVLWAKNGVVDACTCRIRLGPLGTTADPILCSHAHLGAAQRTVTTESVFTAFNSTTIRLMTVVNTTNYTVGTSGVATPVDVTVSDLSTSNMILTLSIQPAGATDIPTIANFWLVID
jgi:hypothetical protein